MQLAIWMGGLVVGGSYGFAGGGAFGQYPRRGTSVTTALALATEPLTCVAYFYEPNEVLLGLLHISDYNAEAHAQYQVP